MYACLNIIGYIIYLLLQEFPLYFVLLYIMQIFFIRENICIVLELAGEQREQTGHMKDQDENVFLICNHTLYLTAGTAVAVTAGYTHTCALLIYGSVGCWGSNAYGQLGTGNTTSQYVPTQVPDLAAGKVFTLSWIAFCSSFAVYIHRK
jgi:hypothetical protein